MKYENCLLICPYGDDEAHYDTMNHFIKSLKLLCKHFAGRLLELILRIVQINYFPILYVWKLECECSCLIFESWSCLVT